MNDKTNKAAWVGFKMLGNSLTERVEAEQAVFLAYINKPKKFVFSPDDFLCQDLERKLSLWFESKVDAKETFRRTR